eukprot:GHVS01008525.1.p1 GENE.GHVS01008525.1~~GHVS01008525.1.p1  ORF type:complete len:451 (-),score=41.33 GHVS01008525.1:615-1967(-)
MSTQLAFRQLREALKQLGYPRLISADTFRTPNFELVAEILDWFVRRYDPRCSLTDDITTEDERVKFVKAVVKFFGARARLQFDARKVYASDATAIPELLKIARLLLVAQDTQIPDDDETDLVNEHAVRLPGSRPGPSAVRHVEEQKEIENVSPSKLQAAQNAREISSDLVESGAALYDALDKHDDPALREPRLHAVSFLENLSLSLDSSAEYDSLKRVIRETIQCDNQTASQLRVTCKELEKDLERLSSQNEKKEHEIERAEKRLGSLQTVKPAFLEEYDRKEKNLVQCYAIYMQTYRNLDYLEHQLDLLNSQEQEQMEENQRRLKRMQKKLRDDEWRLLRGEHHTTSSPISAASPTSLMLRNRADVGSIPPSSFSGGSGGPFSSREVTDAETNRGNKNVGAVKVTQHGRKKQEGADAIANPFGANPSTFLAQFWTISTLFLSVSTIRAA